MSLHLGLIRPVKFTVNSLREIISWSMITCG
ncbi:hypothetical protein F442_22060 [Phytophthora nicotianae P10297]|uniref:Uncharacterized protein n=3 Tax=Phytophthora nicotianae TaxID=4792 RepID=W2PGH0_PHYN3|nr:hypothetical protein PPTG_24447 [Phytophthora nicotianae INRA-310]ETL24556.1 hypothetical protein L916_21454 [Phytophthora nicotianae]ETM99288.1 hypothetical protein PPTG_24447 [Phytophthora nicotianae INRA-310]ETP28663.1 hypothetical protein F442_22060 [Phytophthora nicotianae P10297]